jgi:hypothetical protein
MEHRLVVTSECGYIYNVVDGEFSVFYDNNDESEYFGKIAKYNNILFVIGGRKYTNVLLSEDGKTYNLYKLDMKNTYYGEAIKFFDDFLAIAFSSNHSIIFVPVEELLRNLLGYNFLICKQFAAQLTPFHQFRFNSLNFIHDSFVISGNFYGSNLSGSGLMLVKKDFSSFYIQKYGWNVSRMAVVDGKTYLLCNYIYGTDKKSCLMVDGVAVCVFHDSYELKDISITDKYIYIVGRIILGSKGTTLNRGIILILDREYKLVDIYDVRGSGTLLGCVSLERDYANDRVICGCGGFINSNMDKPCTKVSLVRNI